MSNMIKTIKYNKVSGGRIQIAFVVVFVTDDDNYNTAQKINHLNMNQKSSCVSLQRFVYIS